MYVYYAQEARFVFLNVLSDEGSIGGGNERLKISLMGHSSASIAIKLFYAILRLIPDWDCK